MFSLKNSSFEENLDCDEFPCCEEEALKCLGWEAECVDMGKEKA